MTPQQEIGALRKALSSASNDSKNLRKSRDLWKDHAIEWKVRALAAEAKIEELQEEQRA